MLAGMTAFIKTEKQREACALMNSREHALLYGGSRSGKTAIAVRNIGIRAMKKPSRHLITRFRFKHCKESIGMDTIPKVAAMCFPGVRFTPNKQDWFFTVPTQCGGQSEIWLGGIDDKERVENVLGKEFSTIYANEASQISYDAILTLRTRLAESSGLDLKFYVDCNPSGKKHWTHKFFLDGIDPIEGAPHGMDTGVCHINPRDNAKNLPESYLKALRAMPKRYRQRFWDGLYLSDVDGALWTDQMISDAKLKILGERVKTVIAVDPSVSSSATSDECGIVVCSIDEFGDGVVEDDLTAKLSTKVWAQAVVNAYHKYEANEVVAEVNQGGDLVEDVIRNIDPNIKVVKVHAAKGKFARAEPVSMLYEQGRVGHAKSMPNLESEMTEWVPMHTKESPNRIDALTWGKTHLMIKPEKKRREVRAMVVGQ